MKIFEDWFAGYTADVRLRISGSSYDDIAAVLDEVDLKTDHTYLVKDRAIEIARWLKLPEKDVQLAGIIGLFHDLGRFQQALKFGTMDDRVTGPHGDMSADIFLSDAPKTLNSEIKIIEQALRYHNLFRIPLGLPERTLLFTQLVRDADKLDIFRYFCDKKERRKFRFIMPEDDGECSKEMLIGVLKGENMQVSGIKNNNDRKLMLVSLVYNMHFGYSFQYMLDKDYLAVITGVADGSASAIMKEVYEYATNWMIERV